MNIIRFINLKELFTVINRNYTVINTTSEENTIDILKHLFSNGYTWSSGDTSTSREYVVHTRSLHIRGLNVTYDTNSWGNYHYHHENAELLIENVTCKIESDLKELSNEQKEIIALVKCGFDDNDSISVLNESLMDKIFINGMRLGEAFGYSIDKKTLRVLLNN